MGINTTPTALLWKPASIETLVEWFALAMDCAVRTGMSDRLLDIHGQPGKCYKTISLKHILFVSRGEAV